MTKKRIDKDPAGLFMQGYADAWADRMPKTLNGDYDRGYVEGVRDRKQRTPAPKPPRELVYSGRK
jgi:hypothetical protein